MDKGTGRTVASVATTHVAAAAAAARVSDQSQPAKEFEGIVRNGTIELLNGSLPEGTRVQLRIKKNT